MSSESDESGRQPYNRHETFSGIKLLFSVLASPQRPREGTGFLDTRERKTVTTEKGRGEQALPDRGSRRFSALAPRPGARFCSGGCSGRSATFPSAGLRSVGGFHHKPPGAKAGHAAVPRGSPTGRFLGTPSCSLISPEAAGRRPAHWLRQACGKQQCPSLVSSALPSPRKVRVQPRDGRRPTTRDARGGNPGLWLRGSVPAAGPSLWDKGRSWGDASAACKEGKLEEHERPVNTRESAKTDDDSGRTFPRA